MTNRETKLKLLLSPIRWDWSSSIRSRQNLVIARHKEVNTAYPFLNSQEKEQVKEWRKKEAHRDLWE